MLRMRSEAPRGLRWGAFSLALLFAMTAVSSDPADARSRRKRVSHHHHHRASHALHRTTHTERANRSDNLNAGYAAIVVDGNSGNVMHATNADALRHPASLTKIMTLYLLFERLDAGKIKLDTPLAVSEHAARQSPTKLGLKAGSTIPVEDAIKGMVTRSANDAAVVVAESLGGSEAEFGKIMTRKAQALGMSRTVYKNASGLPDDEQVTSANDQSILGRAIQERFPRYYRYFSTKTFSYRGHSIGNHNRLLGRVEGVDGIKTGYTHASGFNLVTSMHRGNRYLVAVVLGGSSAGSRDARMRALIDEHVKEASTKRTAPMVAEAAPKAAAPSEPKASEPKASEPKASDRYVLASISAPARSDPAPTAAIPVPRSAPGSTDPIRPVAVKTLTVKPGGGVHTASVTPMQMPKLAPAPEQPSETAPPAPAARAGLFGLFNVRAGAGAGAEAAPPPIQNAAPAAPARAAAPPKPQAHNGWIIQVGAYAAEAEAKQRLATVQNKAARLLAAADPFTETVLKGEKTYYRARFAGLDKDQAEAACNYLKRNDVECLTIKN
jgi:D-alanyl-D-alanine carboxypeptidase